MRMLPTAALLATLLAASASGDTPNARCSVKVSAPDREGAVRRRGREGTGFSASRILDLHIQVALAQGEAPKPQRIELHFFTPRGYLYQKLSVPVPASPARRTRSRTALQKISATLPVAGTTIVNNSLYGVWKVEARFENAPTSCAKPVSFAIEP